MMMTEFLGVMWDQPGWLELRAIRNTTDRRQAFFDGLDDRSPGRRLSIEEVAQEWDSEGFDVYYGVVPRSTKGGKAENVEQTSVLWADLDIKDRTRQEAIHALWTVLPPPQIIVNSGYGFHAYWLLAEPTSDWTLAEAIMRGLADLTGGDRVYDRARVLRLPGTHNHKHGAKTEVSMVRFNPMVRYPIEDLKELAVMPPRPKTAPSGGFPKRNLPDWLIQDIEEGAPKGERSEHLFGVVANLLEHGFNDDDIKQVLAAVPDGAGSKYMERGDQWLERYVIEPARRKVGA